MRRIAMYIYALLNCLYIFTIGYIFKKNRKLISNMCELFGYQQFRELRHPEIRQIISRADSSDIVDDDIPVKLKSMQWSDGNISLMELAFISKVVQKYKPGKIFEIGTFNGRTTLNLACNSPEDTVIYTLDLPKKGRSTDTVPAMAADNSFVNKTVTGIKFHDKPCQKKIVQLYGDSGVFDFKPYEGSMDLVFIDGAHTYDYILSDTEAAFRLLKGGKGIILWHDYSWVWPDAVKALNKLYTTDSRFNNIKSISGTSLVVYINK